MSENSAERVADAYITLTRVLAQTMMSLNRRMSIWQPYIEMLDRCPRHDTVLEPHVLESMNISWHPGLGAAARTLSTIDHMLARVVNDLNMRLSGETRVKIHDRLARQLQVLREVRSETSIRIQSEAERSPNCPHALRRHFLANTISSLDGIKNKIASVLFVDHEQPNEFQEIFDQLAQQRTELVKLRATMAKAHDNPSQKLSKRWRQWHEQIQAIYSSLNDVRKQAFFASTARGVRIFGGGMAAVELKTPTLLALNTIVRA